MSLQQGGWASGMGSGMASGVASGVAAGVAGGPAAVGGMLDSESYPFVLVLSLQPAFSLQL